MDHLPSPGRFDRPEDDYAPILAYATEHSGISYAEFDSDTVRRVNLFAFRENFDFDGLDALSDRIIRVIPSIRRIFASPIIRLKDADEILPAQSVRVVNNRTVVHASGHSELWGDLTKEGIKPRKLLTVTHEDDYAIYENLVFVRTVDTIRALTERNMRILREMLYACKELNFNLLDRSEHLEYFLAIGKLHVGYVRDFEQSREQAERLLNKLAYIDRVIRAGMGQPVYKKCRHKGGTLTLKKTNIFRMQKDYHRIYLLMKWFSDLRIDEIREEDGRAGQGYAAYCTLLSIFAAGHFNFTFRPDERLGFSDLHTKCAFMGWNLAIDRIDEAILFTFQKEKLYKILLLPAGDGEGQKDKLAFYQSRVQADEYLLADAFSAGEGRLYLSLFDLDSFRRIQQLLLRGMIRADGRFDVCPFCGQPLREEVDEIFGRFHACGFCGTEILHLICPTAAQVYPATRIGGQPLPERDMRHRNITPVGENGEPLCPCCGGDHLVPLAMAGIDFEKVESARE